VERITDEPSVARKPGKSRYLPIRSNSAFRNTGYDGQDQVVCGSASSHTYTSGASSSSTAIAMRTGTKRRMTRSHFAGIRFGSTIRDQYSGALYSVACRYRANIVMCLVPDNDLWIHGLIFFFLRGRLPGISVARYERPPACRCSPFVSRSNRQSRLLHPRQLTLP
jgi:hypothetical protein